MTELTAENRALFERVATQVYDARMLAGSDRLPDATLNRLLNAARDQGRGGGELRAAVEGLFAEGFIEAGTRLTDNNRVDGHPLQWALELEERLVPLRLALSSPTVEAETTGFVELADAERPARLTGEWKWPDPTVGVEPGEGMRSRDHAPTTGIALEGAVRLAEVGEFLMDCAQVYGDGHSYPRELSISWDWQQSKPDEYGEGVLLAQATRWHDDLAVDGVQTEARKLREALQSSSGFVPREPTAEMYAAGWAKADEVAPNSPGVITHTVCGEIWRAMFAAAPSSAEQVERDSSRDAPMPLEQGLRIFKDGPPIGDRLDGLDLDVLEKVALDNDVPHEHARPWEVHQDSLVKRRNPSNEHVATSRDYADFIATFDPPTVLKLIRALKGEG